MKRLLLLTVLVALLTLPLAACAKPVSLSVYDPQYGTTVTEPEITVKGYVSDAKATVWVNDTVATVKKAGRKIYFSAPVTLEEGENTIKVVAAQGKAGKWKNVISKTVTVTYSPE